MVCTSVAASSLSRSLQLNKNTTMTIEINLKLNWIKIYCYNYYYNPPSPPSLLTETTSSYSSRMSRITWLSVSTTTHNVLMVSVVSCSRERWRVRHICHRRRGRRRRHVIIARIFKDGVHHHRTTPKGQCHDVTGIFRADLNNSLKFASLFVPLIINWYSYLAAATYDFIIASRLKQYWITSAPLYFTFF